MMGLCIRRKTRILRPQAAENSCEGGVEEALVLGGEAWCGRKLLQGRREISSRELFYRHVC